MSLSMRWWVPIQPLLRKESAPEPLPISRIEDQYGNVIATFTPQTEVLPADAIKNAWYDACKVVMAVLAEGFGSWYGLKMPFGENWYDTK